MRYTALYIRTSTERQVGGLESQRRALESYCEAQKITDYKIFEDFGVSGAKARRPGLSSLLDAAQRGELRSVLVYSLSRLARSTKHLLDTLELLSREGISFVSLTEKIETETATGRAITTILSSISQLERQALSRTCYPNKSPHSPALCASRLVRR